MNFLRNLFYLTFFLLLQLLVEVKSQKITTKPDLRFAHTATVINDKLYVFGGGIPDSVDTPGTSFLRLDIGTSFDTDSLTWTDLSSNIGRMVPPHEFAAAGIGGPNNNSLFLYGGFSIDGSLMARVYMFDPQSLTWSIPEISGTPSEIGMLGLISVSHQGSIYLFGGARDNNTFVYTNDMFILDTINLSWKQASSIGLPNPGLNYGTVLLPDNNILYFGGFNHSNIHSLNELFFYSPQSDTWTKKITTGVTPSLRIAFSTVLGLDGQRVIIFGGIGAENTPLFVLDLNTFSWYIPKVAGKIPSSRTFHKSVVINKYMVVTFGSRYKREIDNDILLLDISNNDQYIWTTFFEPPIVKNNDTNINPNTNTNTTNTSSQPTNKAVPISLSLVGIIILIIICILIYKRLFKKWIEKRRKKRKQRDIEEQNRIEKVEQANPTIVDTNKI